MKLIRPSAEIWTQEPGISGIYKQIERCARVCYKSEDKIGEGTAEKMVKMLMEREHTAMLEHGTVYLNIEDYFTDIKKVIPKYQLNKYSVTKIGPLGRSGRQAYITTNYRVLIENNWLDDLQYQCEPTEHHEKRVTVHFICDKGISHQLVRHRVFSFAQESTRYCNYSKDKFGGEITFIEPLWLEDNQQKEVYLNSLEDAENTYMELLHNWTPQQARAVLPNSLKTEVCMTGFISDWEHFFELRTAQNAHPQMRELAIPLKEMMI